MSTIVVAVLISALCLLVLVVVGLVVYRLRRARQPEQPKEEPWFKRHTWVNRSKQSISTESCVAVLEIVMRAEH